VAQLLYDIFMPERMKGKICIYIQVSFCKASEEEKNGFWWIPQIDLHCIPFRKPCLENKAFVLLILLYASCCVLLYSIIVQPLTQQIYNK
jgi:hypothetical protein